jgi:hypothetical protein
VIELALAMLMGGRFDRDATAHDVREISVERFGSLTDARLDRRRDRHILESDPQWNLHGRLLRTGPK